ncbi:coiled-coil domain-containing protein [Mammaliicoccus lentus]|jgi:chromosome segregation ATPase|uniref:coiled-coil domain-containing protein n=1 Tax=Mammaliicoccus lentus TaxID=42858 RepID=UPI0035153388
MAEIPTQVRYLQDTDGERYLPMTHIDCVIGLEQFDNTGDIEGIRQLIEALNTTISSLQTDIETLNTNYEQALLDIEQNKTDIESLRQEIEALKNDSTIPSEEGE